MADSGQWKLAYNSPSVVELVTPAPGEFHQLSQAVSVGRDSTEPGGQIVEHRSIAALRKEGVPFRIGPEAPVEGRRLGRDNQLNLARSEVN